MKNVFLFLFMFFLFVGGLFAQNESYKIQKNETLDSLAKKFDVSKEAILGLNPDLKEGELKGEIIVVPPREMSEGIPSNSVARFKEYRVKHKETLYRLAKESDISVDDIKKYNPYLYDEELGEDDMIRIPIFKKEKNDFNKSIQTSTFKNITHVVMPKETRYGISKNYKMSIKELDSLNPRVDTLQPGQVLKVINPFTREKKGEEREYEYYDVKAKETLYSLTKELDISQDSLEHYNPILKELGLQKGMELKIPIKGSAVDVISSLVKLDLSQYLDNTSTKRMAVMLPFNLQNFKTESVNKKETLKGDPVLQISLDLYSGIKAAIDSVQKLGIPVKAKVFDTEGKPDEIEKILKGNNFKDYQFIVGPLLSSNIEKVAKYLENEDIGIFSPLTDNNLNGSDKIFQTRPSSMAKERLLLSYLDSLKKDKNILILGDKDHESFTKRIRGKFPSARMIRQKKKDYLQRSDIVKLLDKNKPNWVILETKDYGALSNAVSNLNAVRSEYEIRIFTSDKNNVYEEEVPSEYLSNLNFTYTSVDRSDTFRGRNTFVKSYLDKYKVTPNSYAVRGFDVTFDALLRLASDDDIFKSIKNRKGVTQYVDNRFKYNKKKGAGFENAAVYLIKFDKNLELEILNTLSL